MPDPMPHACAPPTRNPPRRSFVHVVVVVCQKGPRRLHVAHASKPQLEVDALVGGCLLELGDLVA